MISKSIIASVLEAALSTGGDFAELFIEDTERGSINFLDGQLESSQSGRDFGVGIRIFSGLNSVYAYTNSFDMESLISTAKKAAAATPEIEKGTATFADNVLTLAGGTTIAIAVTVLASPISRNVLPGPRISTSPIVRDGYLCCQDGKFFYLPYGRVFSITPDISFNCIYTEFGDFDV